MNGQASLRFRQRLFYCLAGLLGVWMVVRMLIGVFRLWSRAG
jgi:hypothetical protein